MVTDLEKREIEETEAQLQSQDVDVIAIAGDIRKREEIDRVVDAAAARWGQIDVLVNDAAVSPRQVPFLESSPDGWRNELETNIVGVLNTSQAVARVMVKSKTAGRIVNVSSINATRYRAGYNGQIPYNTSKAALDNITKGWPLSWHLKGFW